MLPVAFSPCPNDTFLFHAWVTGRVGRMPLDASLADIDQLNQWALQKKFPLIKASMHCLGQILDDYTLLPVGAALGKGCGPKIIAREPMQLQDIATKRIAIPGKETTAHLLLDIFCPKPARKIFCLYHEISSLLKSGEADCGLIIHETRFTFQKEGWHEVADLGTLWEEKTGCLLPLGGIAARKDLPIQEITHTLRASLNYARAHPDASKEYILAHSQEKEWAVIQKHIDLYVNEETEYLSPEGVKAIDTLFSYSVKFKS